ncbi:hypothetical protein GQ457_13G027190 [Hibiscus cannabinus]
MWKCDGKRGTHLNREGRAITHPPLKRETTISCLCSPFGLVMMYLKPEFDAGPHEGRLQSPIDPLLPITGFPNHKARTTPIIPATGAAARNSQSLPPSLQELPMVHHVIDMDQVHKLHLHQSPQRNIFTCILVLDFMHLHSIPPFIVFVISRKLIAAKGA